MPIQISCSCGKTLRVKDELAGKKVRCPKCQTVLTAPPLDAPKEEEFAEVMVVEEPAAIKKGPPPLPVDHEEDGAAITEKPTRRKSRLLNDDDDDDRPRKRRLEDDEDDDVDPSVRIARRNLKHPSAKKADGSGIPSSILGGVGLMALSLVIFFGAWAVGYIVPYAFVLFAIGVAAVWKGAMRS